MRNFNWLSQPRFYGIAGIAALFGLLIGGVTAFFWAVLYAGIDFIWKVIPEALNVHHDTAWYIVMVVLAGGVLVGLCQHFLGDYPKQLKDEMEEFKEHKRFESDHIPQGMVTSLVSLSAGASLGPEAALLSLGGGLSTLASDQIKKISTDSLWTKPIQNVLLAVGILAGGFGFFQVARLTGILTKMGMFDASLYQFEVWHLLWAIPAALIGAGAGYLFIIIDERLREWRKKLPLMPFRSAILGGIVFAVIAGLFPLTLFSGQDSLMELQTHGQDLPAVVLLVSGILKLFAVSLLLNTGWKGGTFLPLMSSASILGLLMTLFSPVLPTLVPMIAAMAGIVVISFGNPILALIVMALIAPPSTAGIYILAILLAMLCMRVTSPYQSPQRIVGQEA